MTGEQMLVIYLLGMLIAYMFLKSAVIYWTTHSLDWFARRYGHVARAIYLQYNGLVVLETGKGYRFTGNLPPGSPLNTDRIKDWRKLGDLNRPNFKVVFVLGLLLHDLDDKWVIRTSEPKECESSR